MFLSMTGFESMHQAVNNPNPGLPRNAWQNLTLRDICWHCMTSYDSVSHMLHNVWYIYLQNWVIFRANVGKYSSTMEHMGLTTVT
jgi:hypothetical protein